jgi:20S proteasome alpha/beta subunit
MTLIVGILCKEGVVVGADGAASLGVLGQMTAMQPVKKLSLLHNCMIVGVSGSVGLSQRISGIFSKAFEDKKFMSLLERLGMAQHCASFAGLQVGF